MNRIAQEAHSRQAVVKLAMKTGCMREEDMIPAERVSAAYQNPIFKK